jgi:hypothetical protein
VCVCVCVCVWFLTFIFGSLSNRILLGHVEIEFWVFSEYFNLLLSLEISIKMQDHLTFFCSSRFLREISSLRGDHIPGGPQLQPQSQLLLWTGPRFCIYFPLCLLKCFRSTHSVSWGSADSSGSELLHTSASRLRFHFVWLSISLAMHLKHSKYTPHM